MVIFYGIFFRFSFLSLIRGKDFWIYSLKRCFFEFECVLEDIFKDCFDKGYDGYEMLVFL